MSRNKYPEETVSRILETAFRLFTEKGYDNTSIQDIIDNLGNLSKGAIYYHFKSKEDILDGVMNKMTESSDRRLLEVQKEKGLTGKEKLKKIFYMSLQRPEQEAIFQAAPDLRKNPRILAAMLAETIEKTVSEYVLPIMEEGIRDGSIQTDYPEEVAEVVLLVGNTWMNPLLFQDSPDKMYRKYCVYKQILDGLGLDIVDGRMLERVQELTNIYKRTSTSD